jgi:hypothetical protein
MAKVIKEPTAGKVGLSVYFPSRTGLIQRSWVVPSNPKTADQLLVRSHLATVTKAWKNLQEVERQAWISAAESYSTRSTLGQSGKLTGAQLHTKVNCALLAIGGDVVTTPPPAPVFDPLPITGLEITNTGGAIALNLTAPSAAPDGTMLRGCKPQSAGTYRPASFRFLGTLGSPAAGKIPITTQYTAKFGALSAGQKVFVSINANVNGFEGSPLMFSGVVPAES